MMMPTRNFVLQSALPEEMCVPSLYLLKIRHDNLGLQYSKEINHLVNLDCFTEEIYYLPKATLIFFAVAVD